MKTKQEKYWEKLEKSPQYQLYQGFKNRYSAMRTLPTSIKNIPLIGIKKVKDPFDIDGDWYFRQFSLFEPDTPPMEKISLDKAIEGDLKFLGMTPLIDWKWDRIDNLFYNLAKSFKKIKTSPDYFLVNFSADPYDSSDICHYNLTFFGERK